jgi:hypothetical protein
MSKGSRGKLTCSPMLDKWSWSWSWDRSTDLSVELRNGRHEVWELTWHVVLANARHPSGPLLPIELGVGRYPTPLSALQSNIKKHDQAPG